MSYQRGNGQNGGHFYSNITQPMKIDLNFIVDATNGNGLGVRSLKSNGYVQSAFMQTSASFVGSTHSNTVVDSIASTASLVVGMPVQGSGIPLGAKIASITSSTAITISAAATTTVGGGTITYQGLSQGGGNLANPNPANGYALIQLTNNYKYYLGGFSGFVSPVTGGNLTSTTIGNAYIIVSLGTTTAAQWLAAGVPYGVTPAVGVSFIAIQTAAIGGTGAVKLPGVSGISSVEVVGDPNLSISNSNSAVYGGAYLLVQFLGSTFTAGAYTPAGTNSAPALTMNSYTPAGTNANDGPPETFTGTPAVLTGTVAAPVFTGTAASLTGTVTYGPAAPAAGSVVGMSIFMDISSVTIDGL